MADEKDKDAEARRRKNLRKVTGHPAMVPTAIQTRTIGKAADKVGGVAAMLKRRFMRSKSK